MNQPQRVTMRCTIVRLGIALLWVATIAVTVIVAFSTRSDLAEVSSAGGVFIVVTCGIVAFAIAPWIRVLLVLVATAALAASAASFIAWDVLHDESSTAAIGAVGPAIASAMVAGVGLGVSIGLQSRRRTEPHP